MRTVGKFACPHSPKHSKIFFDGAFAVGAVLSCLGQGAARKARISFRRQAIYICLALPDKEFGELV